MRDASNAIFELLEKVDTVEKRNKNLAMNIRLLKDNLERANHCINEISNQFERGKCSNDYVEQILKEYYENE